MSRRNRIRVVLVTTGDELTDARIEDYVYERLCLLHPGVDLDLHTSDITEPRAFSYGEPDNELLGKVLGWIEDAKADEALRRPS